MAIRFADSRGYRPEWRETREACEATLFAGLAANRGISVADVAAARSQLDHRPFDWLVNVPIAAAYLCLVIAVTGRIADRFRGEPLPALIAVALASIVLSVTVVVAGQVWAGLVEAIRLSSGHLSYRAFRIPWSHHRWQTLAVAVTAVWVIGFLRINRGTREPGT